MVSFASFPISIPEAGLHFQQLRMLQGQAVGIASVVSVYLALLALCTVDLAGETSASSEMVSSGLFGS